MKVCNLVKRDMLSIQMKMHAQKDLKARKVRDLGISSSSREVKRMVKRRYPKEILTLAESAAHLRTKTSLAGLRLLPNRLSRLLV